MTEREALLQAVYANPADDLPRLVFADWLDENGDPERAEFIRLSIARWRTQEEKRYPRPMKARLVQLRAAHEAGWRAELPALAGVTWGRYWCGFVSEAQFASPAALVQYVAAVFAAAPVRVVSVTGLGPDTADAVCRLPQLAGLYGLRLDAVSSDPALWQALTDSEWWGQLYHLIVHPARPMGGWAVAVPQRHEVLRLVRAGAARTRGCVRPTWRCRTCTTPNTRPPLRRGCS